MAPTVSAAEAEEGENTEGQLDKLGSNLFFRRSIFMDPCHPVEGLWTCSPSFKVFPSLGALTRAYKRVWSFTRGEGIDRAEL